MSMEGLLKTRETLQGSVHVGGSHEKAHRREAPCVQTVQEVFCTWKLFPSAPLSFAPAGKLDLHTTCKTSHTGNTGHQH